MKRPEVLIDRIYKDFLSDKKDQIYNKERMLAIIQKISSQKLIPIYKYLYFNSIYLYYYILLIYIIIY